MDGWNAANFIFLQLEDLIALGEIKFVVQKILSVVT